MNIGAILQGLKGKALDLQHIELLKHAYELQDENLKQLKTNNDAIREKAELLQGHIDQSKIEQERLIATNRELLEEIKVLRQAVPRAAPPSEMDKNDCISLLQSWMGSRNSDANTRAIFFTDVDRELNLPPGLAKQYIEEAARRWGYVIERKGEETILFRDLGGY